MIRSPDPGVPSQHVVTTPEPKDVKPADAPKSRK